MPNSFKIYDASAGSGKTYTLVKEYLKLLLNSPKPDSYRNILAITFTNKAVGEMKSRIIDSLRALGQEHPGVKEQNLLLDIAGETAKSPEEIKIQSRILLKNIIHNYAAFEVSTIDGFTHRVLRTFAKDLGLPLNFEVQLRTDDVLVEAVDRLINQAGHDKAITEVLVNYVLSKADDDKSWDISRDLFEIARLLTQETSRSFLDILKQKRLSDFEDLRKDIVLQQKETASAITELANEFFELLAHNDLEHGDFSGAYCPKFFLKLQKGDFNVGFSAGWQKNLSEKPLYPGKVGPEKKAVLDTIQPTIVDLYAKSKKMLTSLQFLEAIKKNLVPLSLISAIQNQIEEIKKENSMVMISEFNATIGKAVKDQPAPFIYERLGEQYRHYFIDEFQDTSQQQWENLIPLVDHTLSIEHPEKEHGSLTLVGDAKQSIYRWRGGKAEQFLELCSGHHPFNIESPELVVLPNNYRSARTIVNFNNDFFRFASNCFLNETHRELFLKSKQGPISKKEGYVNLSFIEAENASEEAQAYPERVLEIIKKIQASGRGFLGICVLTRTRKESIAVANYLSQSEIPVISAESLLVSRSSKVAFINAVLSYCLDTSDKTMKFQILDYLLTHAIEVEDEFGFLQKHLETEGQHFFDCFKIFDVDFSIEKATSSSIYETVEYIIRKFELVSNSDAYLQFYLDYVYEYSSSEGSGIFEFLELWERNKDKLSIVVPKGEDAVQIMTIHSAKGLEFPVVIYPFANSQISDTSREHFWMNLPQNISANVEVAYLRAAEKMKEWEGEAPQMYNELCCNSQLDALNVLYVAMTRPEQQLYVISKMDLDSKGNEKTNYFSGLLISFLKSTGKWDGSNEYHFGNPTEILEIHQSEISSRQQKIFYSSAQETSDISLVIRSGLMWNPKQKAAIEKGQLIHDLFARINNFTDVEKVMDSGTEEGLFSTDEKEELKKTLLEVMEHKDLRKFYENGVENINERDIITNKGKLLRPDRLNFSGNKVSIIDYKTGAINMHHRAQIMEYAEILESMEYTVEDMLLVYINEQVQIISVI